MFIHWYEPPKGVSLFWTRVGTIAAIIAWACFGTVAAIVVGGSILHAIFGTP